MTDACSFVLPRNLLPSWVERRIRVFCVSHHENLHCPALRIL